MMVCAGDLCRQSSFPEKSRQNPVDLPRLNIIKLQSYLPRSDDVISEQDFVNFNKIVIKIFILDFFKNFKASTRRTPTES